MRSPKAPRASRLPISGRFRKSSDLNAPSHRMRWGGVLFLSACLAAAALAVYWNCLGNSFLWDDEQFVVKNVFLTSSKYLPKIFTENIVAGAGFKSNLYRPLQTLTHFLDMHFYGLHPWGHHLTNVLLQAGAAAVVFLVFCEILSPLSALLAAAIFALHPIQSEAVAYVSGRGDILAVLFLCLGLLAFERRLWLSLVFAALAMFSKESLALFPLFLALYEYAKDRPLVWKRHLPFWALSGLYVLLRLTILNFQNTLNFYKTPNVLTESLSPRVFTYFTTAAKGMSLWFWPLDLHHERSWPVFTLFAIPQVWVSFLILAVIILAAFFLRKRSRVIFAGVLWFFIATAPTSNILVLINAIFYDHWFILPGLGLAMAAGAVIENLSARGAFLRRAVLSAAAVLIAASFFATWHYNRAWKTPVSLYTHILSFEPKSAKITSNLGMAYADEGKNEKAMEWYKRSIELSDEFPETHHNLARVYWALGDEEKAILEFKRAVSMGARFYNSWMDLGFIYLARKEYGMATEAFGHVLNIYPYEARVYLGLAQIDMIKGDKEAASQILEKGIAALPENSFLKSALAQVQSS